MGDFDRSDAGQPDSQAKKIGFMIILACLLVAVLGFHFMRHGGPRAATAFPGGPAAAAPAEVTPEAAAEALRRDPTAALLVAAAPDRSLDTLPRNPFAISDAWRASLVRQPDAAPAAPATPLAVEPVARVAAPRVAVPPKADKYKLGTIVRHGDRYMAIVNGQIVAPGGLIDGARVVEIRADRVVLQHADYPDGPTVNLLIEPKLK
jgi:hypothetical protein